MKQIRDLNKFIAGFIFLFFCCSCTTIYQNREADKDEAEKTAHAFFNATKNDDVQQAMNLLSTGATTKSDTGKVRQLIIKAREEYGNIETYSLYDWKTTVMIGAHPHADYWLIYTVKRSKKETQEKIVLQKQNGKVEILDYDVNYKLQ